MSKHTALQATVTMGTDYQVATPKPAPVQTNTALPAICTLAEPITVTPGIPD